MSFSKKSGLKFFSKMGLVKRVKNAKKPRNFLKIPPFGEKFSAPGGGFDLIFRARSARKIGFAAPKAPL